jgi:hypothetical protein
MADFDERALWMEYLNPVSGVEFSNIEPELMRK